MQEIFFTKIKVFNDVRNQYVDILFQWISL